MKARLTAAQKGTPSRLIAEAVRSYVAGKARANLRERLKEGAMARADRDLELAREWFPLDEETWPESRARVRKR